MNWKEGGRENPILILYLTLENKTTVKKSAQSCHKINIGYQIFSWWHTNSKQIQNWIILFYSKNSLLSIIFCKYMPFASTRLSKPHSRSLFTLCQHSFNFKELVPDLQQRKTRLSVSELELKIKTISGSLFSPFKSSSVKVPVQNHSKNALVHSKTSLTLVQTVLITLIQVICWTV